MKTNRREIYRTRSVEEAKVALSEVLKRYNIPPLGQEPERRTGLPPGPTILEQPKKSRTSAQLTVTAEKPRSWDLASGLDQTPSHSEWRGPSLEAEAAKLFPAHRPRIPVEPSLGSERSHRLGGEHVFNYVIWIAECNSILHCQVAAGDAAEALKHVKQLPNLLDCREVSIDELAAIERTGSANTDMCSKPVRKN